MADAVLDGFALLTSLRKETGADKGTAVLTGSCISAVNLAENLVKTFEYDPLEGVASQVERMHIPVIP
jgi:PIN domain nuclease of toxin-antitoxin system